MEIFPFVINNQSTPHVGAKIFGLLDNSNLLKCRAVTKVWRDFIDSETSLWSDMSPQLYCNAAEAARVDICQLMVKYSEKKNPATEWGNTPLLWAARQGHYYICSLILDHVDDKNPPNQSLRTPLHWAATNGHLDICRLIIQRVTDKNPADQNGKTPLHCNFWSTGDMQTHRC